MNKPIGQMLREQREAEGLSQAELAKRIDSTQSVVSRMEQDDYEAHTVSRLRLVAAALGCELVVTLKRASTPEETPTPSDTERRQEAEAKRTMNEIFGEGYVE